MITPDLPGLGESGPPRAYDAGTLAATLAASWEALEAGPGTLVGHDFGGSLAFRLALDRPDLVRRLVVMNAPFRRLDIRRGWHIPLFNLPLVPEAAFAVIGDRFIDLVHRHGCARPDAIPREAIDAYKAAWRSWRHRRALLSYYRIVSRQRLIAIARARLRRREPSRAPRAIVAPTMPIWGMQDRAMPPSLLPSFERDIPGVRIERLAGCGHFVPEERPDDVIRLVRAFDS